MGGIGAPLTVEDLVRALDLTFNAVAADLSGGISPGDLLDMMVSGDFQYAEGVANFVRWSNTPEAIRVAAVERWSRAWYVDPITGLVSTDC